MIQTRQTTGHSVTVAGAPGIDLTLVYGEVTTDHSRLIAASGTAQVVDVAPGALGVSALVRSGATGMVVEDCEASPFVEPKFAKEMGLRSAVLLRVVLQGETFVVVFGSRARRFAEGDEARAELRCAAIDLVLTHRTKRGLAAPDAGPLESLIREITETVEGMTSLEGLIERIGELIRRALATCDPRAHGSIWLVEDRRGEQDRGANRILHCRNVFSRQSHWPYDAIRPFGKGLVGWVGEHRLPVHALIGDPAEVLPDGTPVMEKYTPWQEQDETRAELTLPMIYAGRLVGVLNLERPEPERFTPEFVLTVQVLALHSAQAIQQQRIDQLYSKILGEGDIAKLSEMVIREASQFIEAPSACIYLWDVDRQQLCLEASTSPIITTDGRSVETKSACYESAGIGLTRWAFDQRMWLILGDVERYSDPTHLDHSGHRQEVLRQILHQALGSELPQGVEVETVEGIGEDHRRFWRVTAPGRDPLDIPQPIWSGQYRFLAGASRSMIVLPVIDARENGPVLGVLLFSRREEGKPFNDNDVALLQGLAKHIAQALLRTQTDRAQEMERSLVSQVVRMEPTHWSYEFQYRLKERLKEMRTLLGADLILVRMLEENELTLVAHDPDEAALAAAWGETVRIPKTVPLGIGGSGQAAALERPFHIPDQQHEDSLRAREFVRSLGEEGVALYAFLSHVQSEMAVPLSVGGRVMGTLTVASDKRARREIQCEAGTWFSKVQGVQAQDAHYLNYHTNWIGPALETLGVLVRRSRQLSSLSIAVRKLTETVPRPGVAAGRRVASDRFHFAAMVVATHHDGLGFHQAFVAERVQEDGESDVRLCGKDRLAWGVFGSREQFSAHQRQGGLEDDIDAAMNVAELCKPIQDAWEVFKFELPYLPEAPCVFVRQGAARYPTNLRVAVHRASSGDAWDNLLDAFCFLFSIPKNSDAARDLALGMVKLGKKNTRVMEVMFVTNVGFHEENGLDVPYIDSMPIESIDVLDDLGVILTLAEGVEDLDKRVQHYRKLKRKFKRKLNELNILFNREPGQEPLAEH
jgi:GAF domain-containing protein